VKKPRNLPATLRVVVQRWGIAYNWEVSLTFVERPSSTSSPIANLVLLHGLGADEHDLLPIAYSFDDRIRVIGIRAPLPYAWGGFSWFDLEIGGAGMQIDFDQARASLAQLAQELSRLEEPILLVGFSQGAIMSIGVLLEHPSLVFGVVAMSGGLLPAFQSNGGAPAPLLMTHGRHDPVVPFEFGHQSSISLAEMGILVDFEAFDIGHEINEPCMNAVSGWLNNRLERLWD
jgi:phospholipase/carboxylesterase